MGGPETPSGEGWPEGAGPALTCSEGTHEGHQRQVQGIVPGRNDEDQAKGLLPDEGGVQLCGLGGEPGMKLSAQHPDPLATSSIQRGHPVGANIP